MNGGNNRRSLSSRGGSLIAVALGIAVDVTDVGGQEVQVAAWAAVALGLAIQIVRAAQWVRRRFGPTPKGADVDIGLQTQVLGERVLDFIADRQAHVPRRTPLLESRLRHPLRTTRRRASYAASVRAFDRDTVDLYFRVHGADVASVLADLREHRVVAEHETQMLLAPESPADIRTLGLRLIDLAAACISREQPATTNQRPSAVLESEDTKRGGPRRPRARADPNDVSGPSPSGLRR